MGTKRLTRKEIIQEDKIHTVLSRTYDWSGQHAKWLVVALGIGGLALLGSYGWRYYQQSFAEEIQGKFSHALEVYNTPLVKDLPATPDPNRPAPKYRFQTAEERYQKALEEFVRIAEDYPRTPLASFARYYVGLCQHHLGKTPEAKKALEDAVATARQPETKNLARSYLAELAHQEKNQQLAIQLLNQILEEPNPTLPKQRILLRLGRSYEAAAKMDDALKQYNKVIAEHPNTEESTEAQSRVDELQPSRDAKSPGVR